MGIKHYIPGAISTKTVGAYEVMRDNLLATVVVGIIGLTTVGIGIEHLVNPPHSLQEGGYSKTSSAGKNGVYYITDSEGNNYVYDSHRLALVPKSR